MRCWCVFLLAVSLAAGGWATSVYDLMSDNPDLSEFLDLVKSNEYVAAIFQDSEITVFAPTNAAMRKYKGERTYNLLNYHIGNQALSLDQLTARRFVPMQLKGNQPVFISVPQPGHVFVNNARILRSNIKGSSGSQEEQVMHIIDEVLEPTVPIVSDLSMNFNPSALELLTNSDKYDMGGASVRKFYETAEAKGKLNIFNPGSFHTYFIPVDEHFDSVWERITEQVVDGHVIPGHALFMRTMGDDTYETLAFNDMLKVTIRLRGERRPIIRNSTETAGEVASPAVPENLQQADRLYEAQSTILLGNIVLQAGSALSKVVKPNIAVRNGVVHLIKRPLLVTNARVLQLIQEGQYDRFYEFHKLIQKHASDFMMRIMVGNQFTIFVPSNEAFYNVNQRRLREILDTPGKLKELLNLHVVQHIVTTESVRKMAQEEKPYRVDSNAPSRSLYLSVTGGDTLERTLTVEGGSTNATVIVPDISLSNGVVHIIDRFLGIPYQTVAERIAIDPLSSVTNSLAVKSGFTQQLKATDRMTLLLPADVAWLRLKAQLNTSYSAIFANPKSSEVLAVLNRHLVFGQALSIQEMANITATEGGVTTTTDHMVKVLRIPGSTDYLVEWHSLQARVVRWDEECTNGYIHVIDAVLIGAKDVTPPSTAAAASAAESAALSGLLLAACWTLLRL